MFRRKALFAASPVLSDDVEQVKHDDDRDWNPDRPQQDASHGMWSLPIAAGRSAFRPAETAWLRAGQIVEIMPQGG